MAECIDVCYIAKLAVAGAGIFPVWWGSAWVFLHVFRGDKGAAGISSLIAALGSLMFLGLVAGATSPFVGLVAFAALSGSVALAGLMCRRKGRYTF